MNIKQNLVASSKFSIKCPNPMTPIGLCVHNTANDATASGEISYMISNANAVSFHIAVDDVEAVQGIPLDRNAWHAGDGSTGTGNRKYIGIEICYSKSGGPKFDQAETNAIELIAQLLKERGWGVDKVKKHQDFSGKYCPHRTLDLGWDRFINRVKLKLGGSSMADTAEVTKLRSDLAQALKDKESLTNQVNGWVRDSQNGTWVSKTEVEKKVKEAYDKGFADGEATVPTHLPANPEIIDTSKMKLNGVIVTIVEGNKTTSLNYDPNRLAN